MKFIVHTDGGARGNPGPAAVGVVIEIYQSDQFTNPTNEKAKVIEFGKRIGETTNNVAEYTAVIEALREVKSQKSKVKSGEQIEIQFFLDSNLVVQQLNGKFRVKDAKLRDLMMQVKILEQDVGLPAGKAGGSVQYAYIPREQNTRPDRLVNRALDG